MKVPYWLLRLLPMWDYICPRCRREVHKNSHKCPYCGEHYGFPLRVPPRCLKDNKALEEYVHKHVFPKVSAWQREYLAQYFTTLFSDGFESGDFSAWTSTGAAGTGSSVAVTTDQPHTGTYSAKMVCAAYGYARAIKDLGTDYPTVYTRIYVRFDSLAAATPVDCFLEGAERASSTTLYDLYISATTLRLRRFIPSQVDTDYSHSFSANTWYCIEVKYLKDAVNGEYRVYLDGTEVITVTGLDTSARSMGEIKVGWLYTEALRTQWVDCVVVADTYIGPEGGTQTKTYTVDVLFKKLGITKTYTIDSLFKKRDITTTYNIDAVLKKLGLTKNYTIDALLKKLGITKEYSVEALFKKLGVTKTYTVDTIFQAQGVTTYTKTYTIDALLKKLGITTSYSIDTLFKKLGLTKTYTVDSTFVLRKTKTYTLDTLLKKYGITRTYTIDTIIGQPTPEAPVGGGFPFWWEKAEAWAPSLFALFRRERAYYQTQIQLAKKENVTISAKIQLAKPSRTIIKTQPIIMAEETKATISASVVLAKPSQTTIEAAPFKVVEPAMNIIPSEIKMLTYPELIRTVKVIHKKRKGKR